MPSIFWNFHLVPGRLQLTNVNQNQEETGSLAFIRLLLLLSSPSLAKEGLRKI